jgi:osmoprotectant transport system ATP-binding protein
VIRFDHASRTYAGGVEAVRDLDLEVAEGEVLVLLGTSGSGKTTAMKMVNRLVEATGGRVLVEGRDVRDQDPVTLRRSIGYAVQQIGLFPHMTIGENVAVVPELLGWEEGRRRGRVEEMLAMVGLDEGDLAGRYPHQLSGGQQQRVGVARALAADPKLALMDEPFGALDPITREELQGAFIDLQRRIRKTIIFVTHDVAEAVRLADRIALLDEGALQQLGTPVEMLESPANEFVEEFVGRHRSQLLLLTHTVRDLGLAGKGEAAAGAVEEKEGIDLDDTLMKALDCFGRKGAQKLPVRDGDRVLGTLSRERLGREVLRALGLEEEL